MHTSTLRHPFIRVILGLGLLGCSWVHAEEDQTAPFLPPPPTEIQPQKASVAPAQPMNADAQVTPVAPVPAPKAERTQLWLNDPAEGNAGGAAPVMKDPAAKGGVSGAAQPLEPGDPRLPDWGKRREDPEVVARRARLAAQMTKMLNAAEAAFDHRDYLQSTQLCRNVLSADPYNERAMEVLRRAEGKLAMVNEKMAMSAAERRDKEGLLEAQEHSVRPGPRLPETRPYLPRRGDEPTAEKRKKLNLLLDQPITVDFMKADLEWVFNTLFVLTGVNIMADPAALDGKSVTLHVQDVPLRSVLDFIVRNNTGLQYSVSDDAIWITAAAADDLKKLMIFKVYPIHHGLVSTREVQGNAGGQRSNQTGRAGANLRDGSGQSTTNTRGQIVPGRGAIPSQQQGGPNQQSQQGAPQPTQASYIELVMEWLQAQEDTQGFPTGSKWTMDRQSNQLIVYTTPSGHDKVQQLLDLFDQPPIQVLIKARFLEVSQEDDRALGINIDSIRTRVGPAGAAADIAIKGNSSESKEAVNFTGGTPTNIPGTLGTGSVFSIVGRRTDPIFTATITALMNNRNTRILSEPQITALNNKEAFIDITTHFSYITDLREVTTSNLAGNGTAISNVAAYVPQFDTDDIGFTLFCTPSVGRDLKTINLHMKPVIDSLAEGQTVSDFQKFDVVNVNANQTTPPVITRPVINQSSLETDVVLDDGGYVIMGGLIRNRFESFERKIPGLHRIPYIGNLFKSKSNQKLVSNLIIIVEAQILTPRGRTYYKEAAPDDIDVRTGGVIRAPVQTDEFNQPGRVDTQLGVPVHNPVPPTAIPVWNVPPEEPGAAQQVERKK